MKPMFPYKQGFFKDNAPMSRRIVRLKAESTREWLGYTLHAGPLLAREVLRRAELEGFSIRGLYRAKRYLKVKSKRCGGKGTGRRNPWIWQLSVAE